MRKWRNVIVLGIVLVALVVAYFLLKGQENAVDPQASATSTPTAGENPDAVKMLDLERDNIVKIVLKYADREIVLNLEEREVETEVEQEDGKVVPSTYIEKVWVTDAFQVDQTTVNNILYGGVNAVTRRLIDTEPSDLSAYGLDKPVTVTFTDKAGNSRTIEVGSSTPSGDDYYVRKGDGKEVYTLVRYLAEYLAPGPHDLISRQLYHRQDLTEEDMTELTFHRDGELVFSAYLKKAPVDWQITRPLEISANLQNLDRFLRGLSGLKASRVVDDRTDNLAAYGLDNPRYVLEYTLDGQSYVLRLGNKDGSAYYAMMEGRNLVYAVNADSLNYLDTPLRDVVLFMIYVPSIFDTSRLVIEIDGRRDVLEMDISQELAEDDVYIFNGKAIKDKEARTLFRRYYQGAIAISGDRLDLEAKPEGKAEVRLTYTSKAGEVTVVELIPTPDGYGYYAMKNGRYTGLVLGKRELDKEDKGIRKSYENFVSYLNELEE